MSNQSFVAPQAADLTIVCCVEAGVLEPMVVRMVESLRRFGGRWAPAPVWAITPRFGPALAPQTRAAFARLNVEHRVVREPQTYQWFGLWNKIAAMTYAETHATTEYLGFIDSDILCVGEPEQLVNGDFSACVHGTKHLGTAGPGDEHENLWKALCDVAQVDVEALPWVQTPFDQARIRLYFNSGVFSYRRATNFSRQWADICRAILDARVGQLESKNHFNEQIALGLALIKSGLPWQPMPRSHNFDVASWDANDDKAGLTDARLLHYHDAMGAHFWPQFLTIVEETHPQVYNWLKDLGPAGDPSGKIKQLAAKSLKAKRVLERNRYQSKMNLY